MTKNNNKIINEINNELKSKYSDYKGMYLFGSHARGKANQDSDIDLALIFNKKITNELKKQIREIICDFIIEYGVVIDNPIFTKEDFLNPKIPLIENIIREGIFYES